VKLTRQGFFSSLASPVEAGCIDFLILAYHSSLHRGKETAEKVRLKFRRTGAAPRPLL
jgi:hypothetical protein